MDESTHRAAIPVFRPQLPAAMRHRLERTLDSGWIGYGPECRMLEAAFTAPRGGWALATSSCTSALYLAGRLIQRSCAAVAPEIIVPSVTFVASTMAFLQAGMRPVLAEVDPRTLLLEVSTLHRLLSPRTRAVLVVHLYGQRHPDLPGLRTFADRHGLALIEDCAHRVDLLDAAPPLGDLLCYSFNAVKELPGGDGGMLWGRDTDQEQCAREVSNLGLTGDTMQRAATLRHADYGFGTLPGLKLRSNDIAASLVNAALAHLPKWRSERRAQFQLYDQALARLMPMAQPLPRQDDDSCLMYVIKVPAASRDRVRTELAAAGIATSVHYPSLAWHPLFLEHGRGARCESQDERVVTLPSFVGLSSEDIARVAAELGRALFAREDYRPPEDVEGSVRGDAPTR
ncbi:MAG TPA: DegT/DnrJ/EryC1/StrS family aminotransferase [Casimicrobiaceae bacterium]|jgi:dTDP-4-amino-4,6-dideoxygalactose transaminase|nr:DegT/DnrJ/EryC1/StrS family aminotransferase [Casimicrobiaceae bacterium]